MKKIALTIFAASALLAGCSKSGVKGSGTGSISMKLDYSGEYATVRSGEAVDINTFEIKFFKDDENALVKSFLYGEMPKVLELRSGSYTVSAQSSPALDAAFDQPIYGGSTKFSLSEGQVKPVTINCTITNMKVTIKVANIFNDEFYDYKISVTNASTWDAENSSHVLIWDKNDVDTKAGFFTVAPLMIKIDAKRTADDSEVHYLNTIANVAAADHHILTIGAKPTGQVNGFEITIDDSLNEKNEDLIIPGFPEEPVEGGGDEPIDPTPDNPQPSTAPSLEWLANPNFEDMPLAAEMDVNITIKAPETIESVTIDVDSEVLTSVVAQLGGESSWDYASQGAYTMDLINNQTLIRSMAEMGIPTGDQLKGQPEVLFSLSNLVPMIDMFQPASGSQHIFTLHVTDAKGQTLDKALTFFKQ